MSRLIQQLIDCPICHNPFFGNQAVKAHITKEARREVYEYVSKADELDREEMKRVCPHYLAVKTRQ